MLLKTNVSQAAVIKNPNGQILLLQLPSGEWHFPGGRLNHNETWQQGLAREVKEETRIINFEVISILCVENWIQRTSQKPCLGVYFYCQIKTSPHIKLCSEHNNFAWIDKTTDLYGFIFYHHRIREIVQDVLDKKKNIIKPPQFLKGAVSVQPVSKFLGARSPKFSLI